MQTKASGTTLKVGIDIDQRQVDTPVMVSDSAAVTAGNRNSVLLVPSRSVLHV